MSNSEIIKSIKNDFRLGMNGVVSTSMRNKGMDYKIIFGLALPQIRTIAEKYPQSQEVATTLWNENIRESKLLATMIYPYSDMNISVAKEWINGIKYYEVSDIATMFLFSKLPFAEDLIMDCIESDDENKIYFALRLFIRLLINKTKITSSTTDKVKSYAKKYSKSDNITIANIANDLIFRTED